MATKEEILEEDSTPFWLTHIDWSKIKHRGVVAASLVKGAYRLERERPRVATQATQKWWEFFGFKLDKILQDHHDSSYIGAIYKYNKSTSPTSSSPSPPKYVIAFRGTILKNPRNWERDLKKDLRIFRHKLHQDPLFEIAWNTAVKLVKEVGQENVWLAGHSLGSSIALLVGRRLVEEKGFHLETYLFNPPFPSMTMEPFINHKEMNSVYRIGRGFYNSGVAALVGDDFMEYNNNLFKVLSNWTPYLFVHEEDVICFGYIGYFEQRGIMESINCEKIGQVATQTSVRSALSYLRQCHDDGRRKEREPIHLLPTANLFKSSSPLKNLEAHRIKQWFQQEQIELCTYRRYEYKVT